jgi:hypothetical protein
MFCHYSFLTRDYHGAHIEAEDQDQKAKYQKEASALFEKGSLSFCRFQN